MLDPAADGPCNLCANQAGESLNSVRANSILALPCRRYQTTHAFPTLEVEHLSVIYEGKTALEG